MRSRLAGLLAAGLVLGLMAAACSSKSSTGGGGGSGSPAGGGGGSSQTLTIQNFSFNPDTLTAGAGETVTIAVTNKDSTTHSFTLDDGSVTQDVPPGQTVDVKVTWPSSGSVGFHCRFHSSMTGTLAVG